VPIAVVAAEGEGRESASTGTAALVGQEVRKQMSEIDNLEGNGYGLETMAPSEYSQPEDSVGGCRLYYR
jgi:hypothetical protein